MHLLNEESPDKSRLSVPGAGLEPAQPQWSQDFKSCVSTIPPSGQKIVMQSYSLAGLASRAERIGGQIYNKLFLIAITLQELVFQVQLSQVP